MILILNSNAEIKTAHTIWKSIKVSRFPNVCGILFDLFHGMTSSSGKVINNSAFCLTSCLPTRTYEGGPNAFSHNRNVFLLHWKVSQALGGSENGSPLWRLHLQSPSHLFHFFARFFSYWGFPFRLIELHKCA